MDWHNFDDQHNLLRREYAKYLVTTRYPDSSHARAAFLIKTREMISMFLRFELWETPEEHKDRLEEMIEEIDEALKDPSFLIPLKPDSHISHDPQPL